MADQTLQTMLDSIVGLQMFIATHAADMRGFGFRRQGGQDEAEWYIHLQCCWRIESDTQIVTGTYDWYESANPGEDLIDGWQPTAGGSLQDFSLRSLFAVSDGEKGPLYNATDGLVVTGVQANSLGDLTIGLSGGYVLRVFPSGSRGEQWRLLKRGDLDSQYVQEASHLQ